LTQSAAARKSQFPLKTSEDGDSTLKIDNFRVQEQAVKARQDSIVNQLLPQSKNAFKVYGRNSPDQKLMTFNQN
jgi:hypothetical protein